LELVLENCGLSGLKINNENNNLRIIKLKHKMKILSIILFLFSASLFPSFAQNPCDSLKILETYSLFSEYHKNKDYKSALPYGWQVLECNKQKFAKWIYYKMEDCLWYLHDSSDIAEEEKIAIQDSMISFYDMALANYPDAKGYFQARKAFVSELWLGVDANEVIKEYETAFQYDPNLSTYYHHRLGQLYKANMSESNYYEQKALDLYSMLCDKEPENPIYCAELENLVPNIDDLVKVLKKAWELDVENQEKAWKYATTAMKANLYQEAIIPLEFLVGKNPESSSYLTPLATAYHRTEQLDKAESTYKKLIQLEPEKKDHYLNLGIVYKDKNQLSSARTQFEKASEVGDGWGLPIYYIGNLYEQAARSCGFEFEDKLVYLLAVDTYRKAKNMDPTVTQAQERISALSTSVPSQEDYFFRKLKSGQSIAITGSCYGWIGRSITVP